MPTSPYVQCAACKKVVLDPTHKLLARSEPCPECGDKGNSRRSWPILFGDLWVDALQAQPVVSDADRYLRCVMLCSAGECLLGKLLKAIIFHQCPGSPHVTLLLDAYDGWWKKKDLFKELTKTSLKEACVEAKHGSFYDAWEKLAKTRNAFAHGVPPDSQLTIAPAEQDLKAMSEPILEVFRLLHNRFAA